MEKYICYVAYKREDNSFIRNDKHWIMLNNEPQLGDSIGRVVSNCGRLTSLTGEVVHKYTNKHGLNLIGIK